MKFEVNSNSEKRYMDGWINLLIRWYFYFKEGAGQINGLRSIGYGLIGLAGVFAIRESGAYWIIALIAIALIPTLTFIGWAWIVRGKKSEEYYQLRYTTVFSRYGIEMQEEQLRQNEKIISLLETINDKLHA